MYQPKHFVENDHQRLSQLVERYPFATLICQSGGRCEASHIPVMADFPGRRLLCHLAAENPQVAMLEADDRVLVVFQGPHAYVSPSVYVNAGVPTWNYAAVHVYGRVELMRDPTDLRWLVDTLANRHEANRAEPWMPHYAPGMLSRIVGLHIHIDDIQGKFKLSQNRAQEDRQQVIEDLEKAGDENSRDMAALMRAQDAGH